MKTKIAILLAGALVVVASPSAMAKGKPTTAPTTKAAVTTAWLSPKIGDPIVVTAGSTVALKFRIAPAGAEVKVTSGITVTAAATACPTPGPTATGTLAFVKPGKSSKVKAFRYSGNSFVYQWKTAKTAALGCYRFEAVGAGVTLPGPIIQIVAGN